MFRKKPIKKVKSQNINNIVSITIPVLVCGSNDKHPIYGNIFITEIGKNDYESTNPKFKYAKIFFDAMIKFSKQTQTLGILTKNHLDQT